MANEFYVPQQGVMHSVRGVVTDNPCIYTQSSTAATFNAVATGVGVLYYVTITPVATGTLQIFDNTTAVAPLIVDCGALIAANVFTITLNALFLTGLSYIVGVAAMNVTLCWRQR